jgi:hypothetical protein
MEIRGTMELWNYGTDFVYSSVEEFDINSIRFVLNSLIDYQTV